MDKKAVTSMWSTLGMSAFLISVDVFLRTRGAESTLSALVIKPQSVGPYSIAIFGILFGGPVLAAFLYITLYYLNHLPGRNWRHRWPRAFNVEVNCDDDLGRKYQMLFFLAFFLAPLATQVYFYVHMLAGTVYKDGVAYTSGWSDHFRYTALGSVLSGQYQLENEKWVTYYPFWQPLLFVAGQMYLAFMAIKVALKLFRGTVA